MNEIAQIQLDVHGRYVYYIRLHDQPNLWYVGELENGEGNLQQFESLEVAERYCRDNNIEYELSGLIKGLRL